MMGTKADRPSGGPSGLATVNTLLPVPPLTMNWVRFSLTGAYGVIVFVFFFLYLTGFISTGNLSNDILYVGFVIMLGILFLMAGSMSESKPSP